MPDGVEQKYLIIGESHCIPFSNSSRSEQNCCQGTETSFLERNDRSSEGGCGELPSISDRRV